VNLCASLFTRLPSASVSLTPSGLCHLRAFALRVAKKKQKDSPSIRVLQRSRDSAYSEPEPVGIDNPFNALDFRQPSLIQNPQAGCLASTIDEIWSEFIFANGSYRRPDLPLKLYSYQIKRLLNIFRFLAKSFRQMKIIIQLFVALIFAITILHGENLPENATELTSQDGRSINAKILNKSDLKVTVLREDGLKVSIGLELLSEESRAFVAEWISPYEKAREYLKTITVCSFERLGHVIGSTYKNTYSFELDPGADKSWDYSTNERIEAENDVTRDFIEKTELYLDPTRKAILVEYFPDLGC